MSDAIEKFKLAMLKAGLSPPSSIIPGQMHRFPGTGKTKTSTSSWCKLFDDQQGGVYGDFSTGLEAHWQNTTDKTVYTKEQQEAFKLKCEQEKRQREAELQQQHSNASEQAKIIMANASPDIISHQYARLKKLNLGRYVKRGPWEQRGWTDALLIPIVDKDTNIVSVQAINATGEKDFLKGSKKKGCFYPFGKIIDAPRIYIGEGLATVATLHAITSSAAIAALDAGNLERVALIMRELAPEAEIILLADNDLGDKNVGVEAAKAAAKAVNGYVLIPELNNKKCDWWDVWNEKGDKEIMQAIETLFATPKVPKLLRAEDFAKDFQATKWLVKEWFAEESFIMMQADPGTGKSFIALDMALHIATEKQHWFNMRVASGDVVYLAGEDFNGFKKRIIGWMRHNNVNKTNMYISPMAFALDAEEETKELLKFIESNKIIPKVIFVDTLSRFQSGSESDEIGVKVLIAALADIMRQLKCSIFLVHHTGWIGKRLRGYSGWLGALDFNIHLEKDEKDESRIIMSHHKVKGDKKADQFIFTLKRIELDGYYDEDGYIETTAIVEKLNYTANESKGQTEQQISTNDKAIIKQAAEWSGSKRTEDGRLYLYKPEFIAFLTHVNGEDLKYARKIVNERDKYRLAGRLYSANHIQVITSEDSEKDQIILNFT